MELDLFPPGETPAGVQREACALEREVDLGLWDPELVAPLEHRVVEASNWPRYRHVTTVTARDDGGALVGVARGLWFDQETNRDHFEVEVGVAPGHRRRGVGTALLDELTRLGRERYGTRILDVATAGHGPGSAFVTAAGFEKRFSEARNICPVDSLDRDMLEEWVRRAKERASEYSLVTFEGHPPPDLEEAFVALNAVMNTAPREDLDIEDEVVTVELLREHSAAHAAQQNDVWSVVARHDPTGDLVGYTNLRFPRLWPDHAVQEDTGVWPPHRGRGLGRWLKAVNALRLLDERPAVRRIETENAGSNDPMLAINHAMGFRAVGTYDWWQRELSPTTP